MQLWDWLKEKLGFDEEDDDDGFDLGLGMREGEDAESFAEAINKSPVRRRDINIHNYIDREKFVRSCCEQMAYSNSELESRRNEYKTVTDRLTDLEEIEALPADVLTEVRRRANRIITIENGEEGYKRPASKITELQFREIERMEDELPDIIKKVRDQEEYQMLVKRDMNILEGEKAALAFKRKEEKARESNAKAFSIVIAFATVCAFALLIILSNNMHLDVKLAFTVTVAVAAALITAVFVTYKNAVAGREKTERQINRSINLQNSAKIRYVNVTNLIDYYYSKYNVNSSHELNYMWEKYLEEKEAREHSENVARQLDEARMELIVMLKQYRVKDPSVWAYQPAALIDGKEVKDLRHGLIIQRQRLRKGIDFETFNLDNRKKDITDMVREYPQYANEVLAIVEQYE